MTTPTPNQRRLYKVLFALAILAVLWLQKL